VGMDDRERNGVDDEEESGMDANYVVIMTVVFLVVAALAVDIGYMYVSEDDLKSAAETSALAGSQTIKQRIEREIQSGSSRVDDVFNDREQADARAVAVDSVMGKHRAVALMEALNSKSNRLTADNDVTVGYWNVSSSTYTPGVTPVNAMQVRTRRTAESETIGFGSAGNFIAKISGHETPNITPDAIAAFPARATAHIAICADACDGKCTYPNVCPIPERKMNQAPRNAGKSSSSEASYIHTTLRYQPTGSSTLSTLVCMEMPPQEVCGKQIYTVYSANDDALRDMESMMYNPNVDKTNKEYDKATGKLLGWWVIVPVTGCTSVIKEDVYGQERVTKYALMRISRICVPGRTGCSQNNTSFDAPASVCGEDTGLYVDRISCVNCGSKALLHFPGLHPVLVK
jgi:hypothetical protein